MSNTGWTNPGTVVNDSTDGSLAWTNPSNAFSNNGNYAYCIYSDAGSTTTQYLKATNFGFNISSAATIIGIEVQFEKFAWGIDNDNYPEDLRVSLVKSDGSFSTTNRANSDSWPENDGTYVSYGSSTDTWGESWSYTDINDSDFGVIFSITCVSDGLGINNYVDNIQIKVYYTEPSSSIFYADASDGGPTDFSSSWNNESNLIDGSTSTVATATGTSFGEGFANNLRLDGTNASGGGDITEVRARIHDGTNWSDYVILDVPTTGWSWNAVAGLEFLTYSYPDGPPSFLGDYIATLIYEDGDYEGIILGGPGISARTISKIEVKVYYTDTPTIGTKYALPAFRNIS